MLTLRTNRTAPHSGCWLSPGGGRRIWRLPSGDRWCRPDHHPALQLPGGPRFVPGPRDPPVVISGAPPRTIAPGRGACSDASRTVRKRRQTNHPVYHRWDILWQTDPSREKCSTVAPASLPASSRTVQVRRGGGTPPEPAAETAALRQGYVGPDHSGKLSKNAGPAPLTRTIPSSILAAETTPA